MPLRPRRVALLFAVRQEMAPLARRLRPSPQPAPSLRQYPHSFGQIGGIPALLIAGGVGPARAGAAAEAILEAWTPDLLVMAGVAGALSPSLAVGDVVISAAVAAGDERLVPSIVPVPPASLSGGELRFCVGTLLSI